MEYAEGERFCRACQHRYGRSGTMYQPDGWREMLASPARVGSQHNGECRHGAYRNRRCRKNGTHQTRTETCACRKRHTAQHHRMRTCWHGLLRQRLLLKK